MHRYGTLDVAARAASAARLERFGGEPWSLKGVHVLDCRTEIDAAAGDAIVPPSLRPGIPAYGSIAVLKVPESPVGPFSLAELRVGVRIGSVAGFFIVGAVCDSAAARKALAGRWGYPVRAGEVRLEELYHLARGVVEVHGRTVLDVVLTERRPLPGTRLNVASLVNLAQGPDGGLVLANTPVQIAYAQPEGGRQVLNAFDGPAFGAGDAFRPAFPMGATIGVADLTLGGIDVVADPLVPAEESVRIVA
jgi:hypothetical protein